MRHEQMRHESIPLGEALPAMQNRTIDGLTAAFSIFTTFKYFDIAKGLTQLPGPSWWPRAW
jgi:TRAP-type transport system periplasmic protein